MRHHTVPDRMTRVRIGAIALVDERTVARAYRGDTDTMQPTSLVRIAQAARRLGLALPPGGDAMLALDEGLTT